MANQNARKLRKNQTDTEQKLWSKLRKRQLENYRFRRQCPIGPYIADFVCFERKLIIELDGSQHYEDDNLLYDRRRTEWLNGEGFRVLRFDNSEVFENMDGVLQTIYHYLSEDR